MSTGGNLLIYSFIVICLPRQICGGRFDRLNDQRDRNSVLETVGTLISGQKRFGIIIFMLNFTGNLNHIIEYAYQKDADCGDFVAFCKLDYGSAGR